MKKTLRHFRDYAFYAFAALLAIGGWGLVALWMHVVTLSGAAPQEITFLSTAVVSVWILVPVYWLRVQWGYSAGMIVVASCFCGGLVASLVHHYYHFSWSVYNFFVIIVCICVLIHLYTSYKCYEKETLCSRKKSVCGVGGIILVMILIAGVFSHYSDVIYWNYMYNYTLQDIDDDIEAMDTLDEKILYIMEKGNVPSLVAGIVVDDELVWVKAYGNACIDTAYSIGSITKPFTATAVLQLYERGLLDLDEDINAYLPFPVRHPHYPDKPITIRMLLQHQSGLARNIEQHERYMDSGTLKEWTSHNFGFEYPEYDLPLEAFLEELLTPGGLYYSPDVWTTSEPGTGFSYSNLGYDLLGYIVEQVTGNLPQYLKENIFDPLGMTNTGTDSRFDNAVPYERVYGVFSKTNLKLPLYDRPYIGAGGIRTTVPDLAQFLIAHMNKGQHPNQYRLLNPETTELMHEQAIPVFNRFLMVGYGMGWEHKSTSPAQYFYLHGSQGHDGGTEGYTSQMWMVKRNDRSYGIIVLANVYAYYKPDTLWMLSWNYMLQDVLFQEASLMAAPNSSPDTLIVYTI